MKSLATSLEDYLKVRRALGYELKDTERLLNHFIHFLAEKNKKCNEVYVSAIPLTSISW